jgi:mRNA interferase MazF
VIQNWQEAGLLLPSVARIHKLATLEKRLIERRLGSLAPEDWRRVGAAIRRMLDLLA